MPDVKTFKKLIEVTLPLGEINKASAREKSIRHGHPSTLHLWWARRPLAAARAVIFGQMVDDPSAHPERFPTEEVQEVERQRLFRIIEELVKWESTTNEPVLEAARAEIRRSWRDTCAANHDHPRAAELFNPDMLPAFHDPFAGGGALPLEAQRLGLETYASDLNPVAVLINKAMIEIPPKFAGRPPVNPDAQREQAQMDKSWYGARGLAEDVRYYGKWMRDEAEKRIGHLYPKVEITAEMASVRPDLKPLVGHELTVIAWLWARTVKSPNPAFANVDVPLASTFMLATKTGKEAYVEPVIADGEYQFTVKMGKPFDEERAKNGTKLARANFVCLMSGAPIAGDYVKTEGNAGRMGVRLMAIIAAGDRGQVYLSPTPEHEAASHVALPSWKPEVAISGSTQYLGVKPYGMVSFDQLFTNRQLIALTTFSDLVQEARGRAVLDGIAAGLSKGLESLDAGGDGAVAYADAMAMFLAFACSRMADRHSSLCRWDPNPTGYSPKIANTFGRQAFPMVWDFVEGNPFSTSSGNLLDAVGWVTKVVETSLSAKTAGIATQLDARQQDASRSKVVSTDPPYYDNVPYADLSDFFYVWLRRSLQPQFPNLFATVTVPKADELVAFAYRHPQGKAGAEAYFLDGMTLAMRRLAEQAHQSFPVTIYYAFKQSKGDGLEGTISTGWETFLDAVVRAGFAISGTWPMRTELSNRMRGTGSNALASSIVLVCRKREASAPTATRREFIAALKAELPQALAYLQRGNIAPVDLAQAAIGPGMAVFTRYSRVLDAEGTPMAVREALALINQSLDEALSEQEGDFDADTRWALTWFDQYGFDEGEYGIAETLSNAKNTSVAGLAEAAVVKSLRGTVRLLRPDEMPGDWQPTDVSNVTVWTVVHQLVRALQSGGESQAAGFAKALGGRADAARELAYRLYLLCERKKRAKEAMAYNGLVQSWPEIQRLAQGETLPDTSARDNPELFAAADEEA